MKMMPPDVISHENQLQHLSEPSIFMLDVFRTADHAGQIFIPHRPLAEKKCGLSAGKIAANRQADRKINAAKPPPNFRLKETLPRDVNEKLAITVQSLYDHAVRATV